MGIGIFGISGGIHGIRCWLVGGYMDGGDRGMGLGWLVGLIVVDVAIGGSVWFDGRWLGVC